MSTQVTGKRRAWREQLAEATSGPDIVDRMTRAQNHVTVNGRHQYSVLQQDGTWVHWPSVTQVTGVLDKPALVHWAAKEQMAADIETAWQLACAPPAQLAGVTGNERRASFEAAFLRAAGDVKAHRKASAKAADLGTQVHALIEHALKTQLGLADTEAPPAASDQALYVYAGFEQWARDVQLEPLCLEARLFSMRHSYAGTLDFLGLAEGKLTVIDWKVSKAVYPEMRLQSIGYRMAVAEMLGIPPPAGTIVRLPKGDDQGGFEVEPLLDDPDATFRAFLALREAHRWLNDAA
jgi:hypothetical protein